LEEISENDSASVSAMSVTAVIPLSPTCRCFTSAGRRSLSRDFIYHRWSFSVT